MFQLPTDSTSYQCHARLIYYRELGKSQLWSVTLFFPRTVSLFFKSHNVKNTVRLWGELNDVYGTLSTFMSSLFLVQDGVLLIFCRFEAKIFFQLLLDIEKFTPSFFSQSDFIAFYRSPTYDNIIWNNLSLRYILKQENSHLKKLSKFRKTQVQPQYCQRTCSWKKSIYNLLVKISTNVYQVTTVAKKMQYQLEPHILSGRRAKHHFAQCTFNIVTNFLISPTAQDWV